jgi:hypothetical protein
MELVDLGETGCVTWPPHQDFPTDPRR